MFIHLPSSSCNTLLPCDCFSLPCNSDYRNAQQSTLRSTYRSVWSLGKIRSPYRYPPPYRQRHTMQYQIQNVSLHPSRFTPDVVFGIPAYCKALARPMPERGSDSESVEDHVRRPQRPLIPWLIKFPAGPAAFTSYGRAYCQSQPGERQPREFVRIKLHHP